MAQAAARRRLAFRPVWVTALASSRMPTRTSPHRPIPAPQSAQVTRLSSVEWSGTMNLVLPHLRHLSGEACVSALIGSGMTLRPFWSVELQQERNAGQVYSQNGLCQGEIAARSGWHPLFACVIGLLH